MANPIVDANPLLDDRNKDPESQKVYKQSKLWQWGVTALVLLVAASFLALFTMGGSRAPAHAASLSLEEMRQGKFRPDYLSYAWVESSSTGQYQTANKNNVVIKEIGSDKEQTICPRFPEIEGKARQIAQVAPSTDLNWAIVTTEWERNFRHSSTSLFWILNVKDQTFEPLIPGNSTARVSVAKFSPDGSKIAFVFENNIYLREVGSKTIHQITTDGAENIFNGNPDWVYEEEVFSGDSAFWWSGDSNYLLYLRTNDTQVPTYPLEYFVKEGADAYPAVTYLNYPKPGAPNPIDDLYVYDFAKAHTNLVPIELPEKIVTEVIWGQNQAVVKVMSRDSDTLEIHHLDAKSHSTTISRKYDALKDGGWFEISHNSLIVPPGNGRETEGYIDTLTVDGYNHLGYFTSLNASEPVVLTRGKWEVADVTYAFNKETNSLFFTATKEGPTRQNIYRVNILNPAKIEAITSNGSYGAAYAGGATHATIYYYGPEVPYTEILDLKTLDVVQRLDNHLLEANLANRSMPSVHFSQVEVAKDVVVNVREIRPSNFDETKEHPVLFYNYGGPGSQMVTETFGVDFQKVFAETHNAVVVTVDPRGTGFMGREFRSIVRDKLGQYEAHDVIEVARQWNAKEYVNSNVTAIWGWSYGGYLTLKTLETDAGEQFKFGVAVAPVTDWKLYDSIYTERYMHTPERNPEGYEKSSITNVKNIGKNRRFMIMHGTGDDNVHIQNTYRLLDRFDQAGIENFDVHVYPDSDHSIAFHSANNHVYDKLDQWLREHQNNPHPSDEF